MKQIIVVLLFVSTFACQKVNENSEATSSPDFENERNAFFNNLMEPAEAAAQIEATGAEFNANLMSDPKNFSMYAGNPVKAAANMGVYLSDLNYSIAYKQAATTKEYFMAAHELSKVIGIERQALEFLMKRYNDNINRNDSVQNIVTALLRKSTSDLQGTAREKLVGIAMAAYQVENLHLALGAIGSYPKDILPDDSRTTILIPLYKMVLGQRANIEIIYGFLKSVTDPAQPDENPNYLYYSNAFEELIALYKRLNVQERIANNQALELMNDSVMTELSEKVNAVRNKITSDESAAVR